MRSAALGLVVLGCAVLPVSAVVKPPLQSQCERLPIKGCGDLVDGALLYAQGDKQGALHKIELAKQQNSPAELRQFGEALRQAAMLPGAESVAQPLNEVADLLGAAGSPAEAPSRTPSTIGVRVAANTSVSVGAAKVAATSATAPDDGLVQLDAREYLVARDQRDLRSESNHLQHVRFVGQGGPYAVQGVRYRCDLLQGTPRTAHRDRHHRRVRVRGPLVYGSHRE